MGVGLNKKRTAKRKTLLEREDMTIRSLAYRVAIRKGMDYNVTRRMLNAIFAEIARGLIEGRKVVMPNLGTLKTVDRRGYTIPKPPGFKGGGETITVKNTKMVTFRSAHTLRAAMYHKAYGCWPSSFEDLRGMTAEDLVARGSHFNADEFNERTQLLAELEDPSLALDLDVLAYETHSRSQGSGNPSKRRKKAPGKARNIRNPRGIRTRGGNASSHDHTEDSPSRPEGDDATGGGQTGNETVEP